MVARRVLAFALVLTLWPRRSAYVSAVGRLVSSPTHVMGTLTVGEREHIQVAVENMYPHDVEIVTFLEDSRALMYERSWSGKLLNSSLARGQIASTLQRQQPFTRGDKKPEDMSQPPQALSSPDADVSRLELQEGYAPTTFGAATRKKAEATTRGDHQSSRGYENVALPSMEVVTTRTPYETQAGCTAKRGNQANEGGFFPSNQVLTTIPNIEGVSVCRLILRMKSGGRAETLKRIYKASQVHRPREAGSEERNSHTLSKGGTVSEPHSAIGQQIAGVFSLDSEQVRLVRALNFLENLDLIILHLEGSTVLHNPVAAAALRDVITRSADVDFVEVDEVVYASTADIRLPSLHSSAAGTTPHNNYKFSSLEDTPAAVPLADGLAGAESLLQLMTRNIYQAQAVAERVRHTRSRDTRLTPGLGPIVAVIDTGVNYLHPALSDQMWVNEAEEAGVGGIDDDGNGFVDDIYGYNFFANSGDPMDVDGHGTHCAGIIAARKANVNVDFKGKTDQLFGVNPHARIMALKFMERQGGFLSDAARSLEYAMQHGALISSNSWGNAASLSKTLVQTVQRAAANNLLLVTAAGNSRDSSLPKDLDRNPLFPAALRDDNVLTVAATDSRGRLALFSNFGRISVPLAAPGLNILSTWLHDTYKAEGGTSQACPLVAGVASLLYSIKPHTAYNEVKHVLTSTAKRLPSLSGKVGYGLIDAQAAALTMEKLVEKWAMIAEASLNIPRGGKKVVKGKAESGNNSCRAHAEKRVVNIRAILKIMAIYEGLPLDSIRVPVTLDVVDPFEYPDELVLGPVVQGLISVPAALNMKSFLEDKFTLRVAKVATTEDGVFVGLPPTGSEYKKHEDATVKLMKVRCRGLRPGKAIGILTLSIRRPVFHRQRRPQEGPELMEDVKQDPAASRTAEDNHPSPRSLLAVDANSSEALGAQKLEQKLTFHVMPTQWASSIEKGSVNVSSPARRSPAAGKSVFRRILDIASAGKGRQTASPRLQSITGMSAAQHPAAVPGRERTAASTWQLQTSRTPERRRSVASLESQPSLPVSMEPTRTTRQSPQLYVPETARLRSYSLSHPEMTQTTVKKSAKTASATSSATQMNYTLTELYRMKFSCEVVDITVEPQELTAVLVPGELKVLVIEIKKGKSLVQTNVTFSVEIFELKRIPFARAHVDPPRKHVFSGNVFLNPSTPVYLDWNGIAPSVEHNRFQEEECIPSVESSKGNNTYYYFTARKEPPAALPHVQFFW